MDCAELTLVLPLECLPSEFPRWQVSEYEYDIACNIRSSRNSSLSVRQIESEETFGR